MIEIGTPERSVVTTCAYCGVGCSFKAEMRGDELVRMVPVQGRQGQPRAFLRQGPLRLGLCHPHGPHPQPDDPRQDHRSVARSVVGRGDRLRRRTGCARIQAKHGARSIGGITSSRCTNEETYLVQKLIRAGVRQQQHRYLRPGLPFAHRLRPGPDLRHLGRHAGFRFASSRPTWSSSSAPTRPTAHPVFASRLKKRLRAGREADRHRPAPDRPGEVAACQGGASPAAAARHQRRRASPRWPM